jgi:hypothetical protein
VEQSAWAADSLSTGSICCTLRSASALAGLNQSIWFFPELALM